MLFSEKPALKRRFNWFWQKKATVMLCAIGHETFVEKLTNYRLDMIKGK